METNSTSTEPRSPLPRRTVEVDSAEAAIIRAALIDRAALRESQGTPRSASFLRELADKFAESKPPACGPVASHCSHPDQHTSLDCYVRYVELEFEGRNGPPLMSHEEWQRL